jgi:hypothetical protein
LRIRGAPKTCFKLRWKIEAPGKPGARSPEHRRGKLRGNLKKGQPVELKEKIQGNLETGISGDSPLAQSRGAGAGATWSLIARLDGTMHETIPCGFIMMRRQRGNSLAFSFY